MAPLKISQGNFKRDIAKLRDQLCVPIDFNLELAGATVGLGVSNTELPGLWFSLGKILAQVTIQQVSWGRHRG